LVNVTNEQVEQSPFEETLWWTHSENEQKKLVQALNEARKGKVVRMETFHINTNNSNSFIDFTITPIFIDSKKPVSFIVEGRDITELKETQIELEKHKNNLEQLVQEKTEKLKIVNDELLTSNNEISLKNEIIIKQNDQLKEALDSLKNTHNQLIQAEKMASLGILTDGVAHEINNPLNYLMGASEGLDSYFQENGSTDKITTDILVHSIRTGVDRISAIVKSLNQFGRDNAKFDENCDVHSIIDNCLIILNNQLQNRILVKKDFTGEDAIIKGNVGKLHQVFLNILTNAIQAIVNEGEIRIQTIKKDTSLFIQIVDNGCGINPDDMLRITDPFFSTKPAGKGTGLGLSITYSILKEHNGSIEIESEMNKGTTAKITIPYT
jgi:signal transduction histidine kinase